MPITVTDNNCRFGAGGGRAMDALSNRNERYYLFTSKELRRRRRSLCRIPAESRLLFLGRLLQQRQRPRAPVMRADREEHVDKADGSRVGIAERGLDRSQKALVCETGQRRNE